MRKLDRAADFLSEKWPKYGPYFLSRCGPISLIIKRKKMVFWIILKWPHWPHLHSSLTFADIQYFGCRYSVTLRHRFWLHRLSPYSINLFHILAPDCFILNRVVYICSDRLNVEQFRRFVAGFFCVISCLPFEAWRILKMICLKKLTFRWVFFTTGTYSSKLFICWIVMVD